MSLKEPTTQSEADNRLQAEFNNWAEAGEGEKMEQHHLDITRKTIELMRLHPDDRLLDLGCGSGWATRLLARGLQDGRVEDQDGQVQNKYDAGRVVGMDVSDEMIKLAEASSREFNNITYIRGSASSIPWEKDFFDKVLSVESFYYYPDQELALEELRRVMASRGRLFILINLYKDNAYSLQWVDKLKVPVHVRSAAEYVAMLTNKNFSEVEARQIPDDTPTPDDYKTKSFQSLADLRAFKRQGALLLTATKP